MNLQQFINKYDSENLFETLAQSFEQIAWAWRRSIDTGTLKGGRYRNIVISGLGGSAISGNFLQNFLKDELTVPLVVNRNYSLPRFANEDTLLIVSSYSGNTEETISVLQEGLSRGCGILCLTTGGKIGEIAASNGLPVVPLQEGFQPRFAFGTSFFSLLKAFQQIGLAADHTPFVESIIKMWRLAGEEYMEKRNIAFQIAEMTVGAVPIILSVADYNDSIGVRMKAQFNENAKVHAFSSVFPEHNHNEIIGWETAREEQMASVTIALTDPGYHPQVKKRFDIVSSLIAKTGCRVVPLASEQASFKERLCDMIYLADWITCYAAVLRGKDPGEIDYIHLLKKELSA